MPTAPFHTPVLLNEVLSYLITAPSGIYVDATLGGGGHAHSLLEQLGPSGRLIGLDADHDALASAADRLSGFSNQCTMIHDHFGNLHAALARIGVRTINGILLDLGVSSFQLDEGSRGFSYRSDDRLDMRMNQSQTLDAAAILRNSSAEDLTAIFRDYGEEKHARRIAKKIVEQRTTEPVQTSGQLSNIVGEAVGARFLTKSLARVFQALRIAVNDELRQLENGLTQGIDLLEPGGRIVVISYHSLEDRIVKNRFRSAAATSIRSETTLLPDRPLTATVRLLTKKPIGASPDELRRNPRARSAKLRVAERL